MLAAVPPAASAQTASASVSGTVQDAQGGALPGVAITLTSKTQGNAATTTTDAEGRFVFAIVRPDTYTLTAELSGFKKLERSNLVVNAADRLSAGILALEVGAMTEEVTVSTRVSELQTTSGERSFTLENSALQNIANNGRALFNFATLVPGAVPNGAAGAEIGSVSGFTVNGQRPNSNTMSIDGVANIDTGDNGGNMATTNIDAVAEFKVLSNAYQAEYGRAVGAQLQVVTKSGSRDFHGSGYWYGRRSDWNANSWTNKRNAVETPKAKTKRNDMGYTIGGPIFAPGFNSDKKKLFFFFSQEHQRRVENNPERQTRVPTALERQGDFSQSVDSGGVRYNLIKDYQSGLPCTATDTRGCFQDGGVLGKIPANRLYAPGLAILNMFPAPNFQGTGGLNYASQAPNNTPRREDMLRLDYQATDNWRVTGRIMKTKEDIVQAYGTTWAGNGSDQLPTPTLFLHPGSNYMLSATGVLSPTMSLEMSWGRAANSLNYQLQEDRLFLANNPAMAQLPVFYPDAMQGDYVPWFQFRGGRTGNVGQYQTDRGPFTNKNVTHDVVANLTKVAGSHALKAGLYYQNSFKPQSIFASFNRSITFQEDVNNNTFDTSFGYANAATGVFNTFTQASKFAIPEWRYHNVEFYAQDNWKAGNKLTLDYGMRFYWMTPQWDESLQASNFLPDQFSTSGAARLYVPVCIGGSPCSGANRVGMDPRLVAQGVTPTAANTVAGRFIGRLTPDSNRFNGSFQAGQGISEQLQDGATFKLSPRIGVVYDVTGKGEMIFRGGWGIFYDRPQGNMVFDMISNAPGVLNSSVQYGRLQDLSSASVTSEPNPVLGLNPTAFNFEPPRVSQWNVGFQRKLFNNFMFDLAYVGSKSDDLLRQVQINAVPRGATFLPQNQDPTRAGSSTVPGATALPTDLLRPYPGYGGIRMWNYSGYSNYHALQTGINRRFDDGLLFSFFYVWSKALGISNDDFAAGVPNQTDAEIRRLDYSYVNTDRPHNFVVNFVYQLPFLKDSDSVMGKIAGDWQLSGVYRWTSGRPQGVGFSIPNITNANLTGSSDGNPGARIVLTCDPGQGYGSNPYQQFNTSCFAPPQPGSDGAESARFFLRQPPINNLDASLSKVFAGPKSLKFEVRIDAFNVLNHTQFTGFNGTANFTSLTNPTITNLGSNTNFGGFGAVSGVAAPRTLQLVTRVTF